MSHPRYPDPNNTELSAWCYRRRGRKCGGNPPEDVSHQYHQLLVLPKKEYWHVHCSYMGAYIFCSNMIGAENIHVDEDSDTGELVVPESLMKFFLGSIGVDGEKVSNIGFLCGMFGLSKLTIKEASDKSKGKL